MKQGAREEEIDDTLDDLFLSSDPDFIKASLMIVRALEETDMDFSKVKQIKELP